ncbi:hypothetical protein [Brachybacterium sacelli]|uniref:Uncharacterized protein n=1 Tax=Brachybacterium sacelli TaxID=173364 RepID=A0ABS4X4P4_9MICO|nr:hypothetical protein [Brachybacterium sacelli]MBP2383430.1 hypothetical protein [Brachybacterium sacelli]
MRIGSIGVRAGRRRSSGGERGAAARAVAGPDRLARPLAACVLVLTIAACDGAPRGEEPTSAAPAPSMDPTEVAEAGTTAVDPSWLCAPGGDSEAPAYTPEPGVFTPETVQAEGNAVTVSGPFALAEDYDYGGFAPDGVVVPADPAHRGTPADGYDRQLGTEDAPAPPLVVRERVEVTGEGAAPSAATARLTLGTCDDAPMPDGQYLLSLQGGGVDGPGRGEDGWSSSRDVMLDVVDGKLQTVPGATDATDGEVPADLSPLECRAPLSSVGDGDGLSVAVSRQDTSVSTTVPEEEAGVSVDARVSVTSEDLGTRALLQGVVLTNPSTGTVVAGARNAGSVGLQWIGEDGVSTAETAWTTRSTCTRAPLDPGGYEAHGFAVTVDDEGATHIVLSDPWTVDVVEEGATP